MSTIKSQFSDNPSSREIGLITGSASATQFQDKPASLLRFRALEGNSGVFYLGDNANQQLFPLGAGDDTGWIPANNMNEYYYRSASGSSDQLAYWRLY